MGQSLHPRTESMSGRPVPIRRPRPDVRPAPSCRIAGGDPPAPETSSLAAVGDSECRAPMPPSSAERTMGLAQRYLSRRGWRVLFAVPDGGRSSLAPGFRPGRWGLLLRCPFEHGAALQWCLRRNSGSASAVAGSGLQFENQADQLAQSKASRSGMNHPGPIWSSFSGSLKYGCGLFVTQLITFCISS